MILDMTCKCGMRTPNIWCPFFIGYTYKSLVETIFRNRKLRVESEHNVCG
jgi:hypothetical protein